MAMKKLSAALLALVLAAPCAVPAVCMADGCTGSCAADQEDAAGQQASEAEDDSQEGKTEGLAVTAQTYKKEFKTAEGVVYKEISFEYPVAEGNSEAAKAFNQFYNNLAEKWIKAAKENLKDAKEIVSAREEADGAHYADDVTCEITSQDDKYICVLQSGYDYQMGAHGMPYRYSYIFDVKTGKKVSAANLLGMTKAQLNKKVRSLYLKKYDKTEAEGNHMFYYNREDVEKAIESVDFNKNLYYLKNGKIRFYVDPYVAGPYAAGFIEVAVGL